MLHWGLQQLAGAVETIVSDSLPLDYCTKLIPNYQRVTVTPVVLVPPLADGAETGGAAESELSQ